MHIRNILKIKIKNKIRVQQRKADLTLPFTIKKKPKFIFKLQKNELFEREINFCFAILQHTKKAVDSYVMAHQDYLVRK